MIMRRTGDSLEKSNAVSRALTVLIIILVFLTMISALLGIVSLKNKIEKPRTEMEKITKLEQRIAYAGPYRGLDVGLSGPYAFAEDTARKERWALSEYFGERFLEEVWRRAGDTKEAEAAHARAEKWAEQTGSLSTQEAEQVLSKEVWP